MNAPPAEKKAGPDGRPDPATPREETNRSEGNHDHAGASSATMWTPEEKARRLKKGELRPGKSVIEIIKADLPLIELPGDNRLLSKFAEEVGEAVSSADIFTRGGFVYHLNATGDGLDLMTPATFLSWGEQFFTGYRVRKIDAFGTTIQLRRTMTIGTAEGVLASPQFVSKLRRVDRFNAIRLPRIDRLGYLNRLPDGYDKESATFTKRNAPGYATVLRVAEGARLIRELLSEFVFADSDRSLAVSIAAMLTVFGKLLLPPNSIRPCFIYLANAEGAGKTLLVKVATVPVLGNAPASVCPHDEEEMRKLLLTAVLEMRPVILLDNFKGRLSSESLEGFLTAQQWSGRVLGGNKTFTGANDTTVFITGNGCTVSPDMRRRSLFTELFLAEERAEDRKFKERLETSVLIDRREEILTALYSLIAHWHNAGQPRPSRGHSSFPDWADVVGGIVESAGFACPLESAKIEGAADSDGDDMRGLVAAMTENGPMNSVTFDELIELSRERGFFESLTGRLEDNAKGAKATLAALFKRYDGRAVGQCRFHLTGKGRNRKYVAEKIN